MDDYLSKPFTAAQVNEILGRWLPRRETRVEPAAVSPVATQVERSATTVLDRSRLEQIRALRGAGMPSVLGRVIKLFLDGAPGQIAVLRAAAAAADAARLREVAHSLKSASANLGATDFSDGCRELEMMGRAGRLEGAADAVAALERSFIQVSESLLALPEDWVR
jgi:HPt (histidine-containing phosphotransfer) domain-containing protein